MESKVVVECNVCLNDVSIASSYTYLLELLLDHQILRLFELLGQATLLIP